MESIRTSRAAPLRKARLLLRLGRSLDHQAQTISSVKAQAARSADRAALAMLARISQQTQHLHDDVREAALEVLKPDPLSLSPN